MFFDTTQEVKVKTTFKLVAYVILAAIYVLLAMHLLEKSTYTTVSDYEVERLMDQGSTVKYSFLDPTVEDVVKIYAESDAVFVFKTGDSYYDSDVSLEDDKKYFKEFSLSPSDLLSLEKAPSFVTVTITAERPIETIFHYTLGSDVTGTGILVFLAIVGFIMLSFFYWMVFA